MPPAVELRGASKVFVRRRNRIADLKLRVMGLLDARYRERAETFQALDHVDLAVPAGECLGVIGPNGSGKSTLLRLMAGIFPPTDGEVVVRGRVAPMIELGVGFHPDLTGRENVYLSTSLYGMATRRTDAIYDEIVAFSELASFMDMPVKNYSTGMYVRLGFAVAVNLRPDILLIDEVLAVGDEHFRQKCMRRMEEVRRAGATLIVVSHDLAVIERMCDRVCLLAQGTVVAEGDPAKVVAQYRDMVRLRSA